MSRSLLPTALSRSAHWVLKIGNLKESMKFYEGVLGMKVLRHEEFDSGCEATCNGPYGGQWSKTMIGYGPERDYFALELTYNYGIDSYAFGNDLQFIALQCPGAKEKALALGYTVIDDIETSVEDKQDEKEGIYTIIGPDSYKYRILPAIPGKKENFECIGIRVQDLARAEDYWVSLLGLTKKDNNLVSQRIGAIPSTTSITVGFGGEEGAVEVDQVSLQLISFDGENDVPVDHALSSGRIAFACKKVPPIFEHVSKAGDTILTPPLTLPTPDKADVVVTILADRDGYEICFVEDEAFYDLATPTYDIIDYAERATRGGDGAPPPKPNFEPHSELSNSKVDNLISIQSMEDYEKVMASSKASEKLVILDFGAAWCKKCHGLEPLLHNFAKANPSNFIILKIDIDEDETMDLVDEFGVSKPPHFFLLQNGERLADFNGSDETEITKLFETYATQSSSSVSTGSN